MSQKLTSADLQRALSEAFPKVEPGVMPLGSRILVQIRTPKRTSRGGIVLPEDVRETEQWNTQIAKVIQLGEGAFRNRDTMHLWPERHWCLPGDFVRVSKYGGDRWNVPVPGSVDQALFVIFNDLDIIGKVTGDPLAVVAFIN